jgi:hypothetical protein
MPPRLILLCMALRAVIVDLCLLSVCASVCLYLCVCVYVCLCVCMHSRTQVCMWKLIPTNLFFKSEYSSRHQIACFKVTERLTPPKPLGSRSTVQRCYLCYTASSELSSLACAPLFVLRRCTIFLWPLSMQFVDYYYRRTTEQTGVAIMV